MGEEQYYVPVNPPAERKFESVEEERDFYKNKCEFYKSEYCGLIDEIENKPKKTKKTKWIVIVSILTGIILVISTIVGIHLYQVKNDFDDLLFSLKKLAITDYDQDTDQMYETMLSIEGRVNAFELNHNIIPNGYQSKLDSINNYIENIKPIYDRYWDTFMYEYDGFRKFILQLE